MLASARVGVGLPIMDSSMLVATMTGLPRLRHPCTILLCQYGTCTPHPRVTTQHEASLNEMFFCAASTCRLATTPICLQALLQMQAIKDVAG